MNFIDKNTTESDKKLFFGDDEDFTIIEEHWIMAHLMSMAGIFPSVSQARKNGWNKPIPEGFNIHTVGKKRKQIFTFIEKKLDRNSCSRYTCNCCGTDNSKL